MAAVAVTERSFADRVHELLEKVDYRRADTPAERDAIYRLRYQAYLREGAIQANATERFVDEYDGRENVWLFGLYIDGQLASSLRLHVTLGSEIGMPALRSFSDILIPRIEAGRRIIDPTRFVADEAASRTHRELPFVTVRLGWLACEYFAADEMLATVRAEHQAFYKRVFGYEVVCGERPYPTLIKPLSLMVLDYPRQRPVVPHRYPFFRSSVFERRMLFERPRTLATCAA